MHGYKWPIAVAGALIIGEFIEGAAVVFLFSLSEWLESRATEKARAAISEVIALVPETACLLDGSTVKVRSVSI